MRFLGRLPLLSLAGIFLISSLLSLFSPLLTSQANASQPVDGAYRTTKKITRERNNYYNSCNQSEDDITSNWTKYLTVGALENLPWFYNATGSPIGGLEDLQDSFYRATQALQESGETGSSIAVSQKHEKGMANGREYIDNYISIGWNESAGFDVDFYKETNDYASVYAIGLNASIDIRTQNGWGTSSSCDVVIYVNYFNLNASDGAMMLSNSENNGPTNTESFFANTSGDIHYPDDYNGLPLKPTTNEPEKITIQPDFTYSLNNKDVTAHDYNQTLPEFKPDEGYTFDGYKVFWSMHKCDSIDEVTNICENAQILGADLLSQEQDYKYTVADYGKYQLSAEYEVQQCYRYPSYPTTPDYCFIADLSAVFPTYNMLETTINLDINGQSMTGDTTDMVCDIAGHCSMSDEICFAQPDVFSSINCRLQKNFKVGLLNPSITAFKNLINSFIVPPTPTCSINMPDITLAGNHKFQSSKLGPSICTNTKRVRDSMPLISAVINFTFALAILYLLIRMINDFLNPNSHDVLPNIDDTPEDHR
jgi:hypothetical protein